MADARLAAGANGRRHDNREKCTARPERRRECVFQLSAMSRRSTARGFASNRRPGRQSLDARAERPCVTLLTITDRSG